MIYLPSRPPTRLLSRCSLRGQPHRLVGQAGQLLGRLWPLLLLLSACTPTVASSPPSIPTATPPPAADWWQPAPGLTWQWQLDETVDTSIAAEVYDIDLYTPPEVIAELRARGVRLICYISVGSWEEWRPDQEQFPAEVLGKEYEGWPGERWLDIRRLDLLAPLMRARLDLCAARGFDAVEPDNLELITNDTGFPLTYADQLAYARWLADEAHARGLAIGQKNGSAMVNDLVELYDFAITEDYFYFGEIETMLPYLQAGKAVFAAEYTDMPVDFQAACRWGRQHRVSFILKSRDLTAWRQTCP